jgi:predicted DNA-binding protein
MKNKTKSISFKISEELYEKLETYKKKEKINISAFIRETIANRLEYLRGKKK